VLLEVSLASLFDGFLWVFALGLQWKVGFCSNDSKEVKFAGNERELRWFVIQ